MNRRNLLKAAPAALLAGAVSATPAAATDTPIMVLFREWSARREWVNGPATDGMSDEEFGEIAEVTFEIVNRLLAMPAQDARDLCCKLLVLTEMGTDLSYDLPVTKCLPIEARALIGA